MRSIRPLLGVGRLALGGLLLVATAAQGGTPSPWWWLGRGVVSTNAGTVTNDYATANAGQVKWIATNACNELEACLPGGAGTSAWNAVKGFARTNSFVPVNLGQIKNVAKPFYDRLMAAGYTNYSYPWAGAGQTNDYAVANVGQLKNLFSFSLTNDMDADSLPDSWEGYYFGSVTSQTGAADYDGDGLVNSNEYTYGANPTDSDTDDDGLTDGAEVATYGTSPTDTDTDNDGFTDYAEVMTYHTDPNNSDTIKPTAWITFPTNGYRKVWVP